MNFTLTYTNYELIIGMLDYIDQLHCMINHINELMYMQLKRIEAQINL